jgi:hypothetical protein
MGTSLEYVGSDFRIPKARHAEALEAIKALAGQETIADGSGAHFSWILTQSFVDARTLEEALQAWRWDPSLDEDGDIDGLLDFQGEKWGDDDVLWAALAPFVDDGGFIEVIVEFEAMRWVFRGGKVQHVWGRITFDEDPAADVVTVLRGVAAERGWTDDTVLALLLEFVQTSCSHSALLDFLAAKRKLEEEQATGDPPRPTLGVIHGGKRG